MKVYDFDKTIYHGDSTIDFYFFCVLKHPRILMCLPRQLKGIFLYSRGKISKTKMKELFFSFLAKLPDVKQDVQIFWDNHIGKISSWYLAQKEDEDIIVSASPEFLLEIICKRMDISGLIASKVDKYSGIFADENCYGEKKVELFLKKYPDAYIDEFYSDSLSDRPMADIARRAFLVRNYFPVEWPAKNRKDD